MIHAHQLALLFHQLSYTGVFFLSFFAGYLIPVPEEVVILAIGYIGSTGAFNPVLASALAIIAIFASDSVLYVLALLNSSRILKLKGLLEGRKGNFISHDHAGRTIFLLRFVAGLRFLGPIFAGMNKVSLRTFLFFDLLALLVYVPAVAFLGYHFNSSFLLLVAGIEAVRHTVFTIALLIVAIFTALTINRRLDRIETWKEAE